MAARVCMPANWRQVTGAASSSVDAPDDAGTVREVLVWLTGRYPLLRQRILAPATDDGAVVTLAPWVNVFVGQTSVRDLPAGLDTPAGGGEVLIVPTFVGGLTVPTRQQDTTMVAIPAGIVAIGSPGEHVAAVVAGQHYDADWFADELPQHRVAVAAFRLDRYPVTNAAFGRFVEATGYRTVAEDRGWGLTYAAYWQQTPGACWSSPSGPGSRVALRPMHPVVHIAYRDALAYAAWAGKRLPTEVEWEYAAHGPAFRPWPWGQGWDPGKAVCAEFWARGGPIGDFSSWRTWWDSYRRHGGTGPATLPVGALSPAGDCPFGVADMAGQVTEWTASRYEPYGPGHVDPVYRQAQLADYRVTRGGTWMAFRWQVRTTERVAADPGYCTWATGFRCAADAR